MGKIYENYKNLWKELTGIKLFLFYTIHYTLLFFVLHSLLFSQFHIAGKSYLWTEDGGGLHLPKMLYVADVVQNAITSLFSGEGMWLPTYDFTLGTREMEIRIEALQVLSAFWPMEKMDVLYDLLVVVRFYLTGLSFSILGFYFKKKPLPVLIGSVSYMFCGFAIYAGVRHPSYLSPLIFFPILIMGVDMVIRGKKGYLLTGIVLFILTAGVYFAYMMALACIFYTIVRFFDVYKEHRVKNFFIVVGRLTLYVLPGVLMSSAFMLQTLGQYLGTGRVGRDAAGKEGLMFYPASYIRQVLGTFLVHPVISNWTCLGFSVLAMPSAIMLYRQKSAEFRSLKIFFAVCSIMLLLPGAAYVMSGFNSYVNRWCFMYALCVAVMIMFMVPFLESMKKKDFAIVTAICVIYHVVMVLWYTEKVYMLSSVIILVLVLMMLCAMWFVGKFKREALTALMLSITCASSFVTAFVMYSPFGADYVEEFTPKGEAMALYDNSQYGAFGKSDVNKKGVGLYRVGASDIEPVAANASFLYDFNSITHFSTAAHNYYTLWQHELECATRTAHNKNYGVDARGGMLALSNVKYYVTNADSKDAVPYGYEKVETVDTEGRKRDIYENKYALPIGYAYSSYMTRDDYDKLQAPEKEQAQLQSVLLEEKTEAVLYKVPEISARRIPFEIKECNNVTLEGDKLIAEAENATIKLEFEGLADSELYLRIKNFDASANEDVEFIQISASSNAATTSGSFYSDESIYSNGRKTQIFNLGYSEEAQNMCVIAFPLKGTYSFEGFEIWCIPKDGYAEQIKKLKEDAPTDFVHTNEGLTCTMNADENKILCMAIPYDKGWSAYVDGEKTKIKLANTGFMAIEVPSGEHEILFAYTMNEFKVGLMLSFVGVLMLLIMVLADKMCKRNNNLKNA